jgi:hypothetical protein
MLDYNKVGDKPTKFRKEADDDTKPYTLPTIYCREEGDG